MMNGGYNQQPSNQQPTNQQRPQYGYTQQPQYGYGQQNTTYTPHPAGGYRPPAVSQSGKGSGWITLLRVFLWIWFGLLCLVGIFACVGFFEQASRMSYWDRSSVTQLQMMGIAALLGGVLLAFLSVAGGMVALDAAANIKRCANNSARILEELQKK